MIRIFPQIRVTGQNSEIQAKNRDTAGWRPPNPNRIAQRRRLNGVSILLQKRALNVWPLIGAHLSGVGPRGGWAVFDWLDSVQSSQHPAKMQIRFGYDLVVCLERRRGVVLIEGLFSRPSVPKQLHYSTIFGPLIIGRRNVKITS